MGRAQELFDRATNAYDKAISKIKLLDEVFQDTHKEMDANFDGWDVRITLAQFDKILQGILLSAALSDHSFHRLERQFIEKITDYGDLLAFFKKQTDGEVDLSWDGIANASPEAQKKLVALLPGLLDECCDSFVLPLATVDRAIKARDFLDELTDYIVEICDCLNKIDGADEDRERMATADMACDLLVNRWSRIAQK